MSSQFSLWLYPLVIFAVVAIYFRLRLGWKWAWAFVVQAAIIGVVGTLGLIVGPDWLFAPLGWVLFVLLVVHPRLMLSRLEHNLSLLNAQAAMEIARRLKLFFWGQPARFWMDVVTANSYFIQKRPDEALAILDRWEKEKLPKAVLDVIYTYRLTGLAIMGDWQKIVDRYEEASARSRKVSHRLALAASRAYLELGDFAKATSTLEMANLPESRMTAKAAAVTLLPFFALTGALPEVETLIKCASEGKETLPEYSKLYWLARCYGSLNNNEKAKETFLKCMELARKGPESWRIRIESQLARLELQEMANPPVDLSEYIKRGWAIFDKCVFVQSVVAPNRFSHSVGILMLVILAVFLVSSRETALIIPGIAPLAVLIQQKGMLEGNLVLQGEYWRLVTFLFLHKHLSHAILNIIGLYWFGRMAENIYGTVRFFAIYLVAGVLSGVAQVIVAPEQAAVGASGAVLGIFGAVAAGIWRLKDQMPRGIWQSELSWMAGLALAQIVLDQIIPQVAAMAHFGGLVAGFGLGMVVNVSRPARNRIQILSHAA